MSNTGEHHFYITVSEANLKEAVRTFRGAPSSFLKVYDTDIITEQQREIQSLRLQVHSNQEEIAKLNSWLKNTEAKERHYDELRRWFNNMETRAIQAEQALRDIHENSEDEGARHCAADALGIEYFPLEGSKPT
jgi:predicted RNase H-like nuclease (RuvC/YqgF family)